MAENAPVQYEAEELLLRGEEWGMSRGRGGVHRGVGRRTRRMAWVKGGARHHSNVRGSRWG